MHDGSMYENILSKTCNNVNNLLSRGISLSAAQVAVNRVIIPQIMYPAVYNNMSSTEIDLLQIEIRKIIRKKMKGRARNLPNDIIHGHTDFGGLGIDCIEDTINAARLKMVERFLNNDNMSTDIMLGTIHRLRRYARTRHNPMETDVCKYIDPAPNMWIYTT